MIETKTSKNSAPANADFSLQGIGKHAFSNGILASSGAVALACLSTHTLGKRYPALQFSVCKTSICLAALGVLAHVGIQEAFNTTEAQRGNWSTAAALSTAGIRTGLGS